MKHLPFVPLCRERSGRGMVFLQVFSKAPKVKTSIGYSLHR
jgi:hypothetical protein